MIIDEQKNLFISSFITERVDCVLPVVQLVFEGSDQLDQLRSEPGVVFSFLTRELIVLQVEPSAGLSSGCVSVDSQGEGLFGS